MGITYTHMRVRSTEFCKPVNILCNLPVIHRMLHIFGVKNLKHLNKAYTLKCYLPTVLYYVCCLNSPAYNINVVWLVGFSNCVSTYSRLYSVCIAY